MSSSTSSSAEPALAVLQNLGGKHRGIGAADIVDLAHDLPAERHGDPVESALQQRGVSLGVNPGGADILVAEHALDTGDRHAEAEKPSRHGVIGDALDIAGHESALTVLENKQACPCVVAN